MSSEARDVTSLGVGIAANSSGTSILGVRILGVGNDANSVGTSILGVGTLGVGSEPNLIGTSTLGVSSADWSKLFANGFPLEQLIPLRGGEELLKLVRWMGLVGSRF